MMADKPTDIGEKLQNDFSMMERIDALKNFETKKINREIILNILRNLMVAFKVKVPDVEIQNKIKELFQEKFKKIPDILKNIVATDDLDHIEINNIEIIEALQGIVVFEGNTLSQKLSYIKFFQTFLKNLLDDVFSNVYELVIKNDRTLSLLDDANDIYIFLMSFNNKEFYSENIQEMEDQLAKFRNKTETERDFDDIQKATFEEVFQETEVFISLYKLICYFNDLFENKKKEFKNRPINEELEDLRHIYEVGLENTAVPEEAYLFIQSSETLNDEKILKKLANHILEKLLEFSTFPQKQDIKLGRINAQTEAVELLLTKNAEDGTVIEMRICCYLENGQLPKLFLVLNGRTQGKHYSLKEFLDKFKSLCSFALK